ncbi:MAG TPA: hypothetical protein VFI03_13215 [Solirubrobacterales bacterium]|nr:hypothetical protein [Solirubrobacterales bacterium]
MSGREGQSQGGKTGAAIAVAMFLLFAALAPASAQAVDIIESQEPGGVPETAEAGWQAGTCTADPCTAETPELFFTQAAGHPPKGFTQIIVKHEPGLLFDVPVGNLKTVLVDLPAGLSVNPQATPQCELPPSGSPVGCPAATKVGMSSLTAVNPLTSAGLPLSAPVFNIAPRPGEPARFGFSVLGNDIFLNAGVAWESDYHEYFTIHATALKLGEGFELARILENRLVFDGETELQAGGGRFLTIPSTCSDPQVEPFKRQYTTFLHADSYEEEAPDNGYDLAAPAPPSASFVNGSQEVQSPLPKGARAEGCEKVPFNPSTSADPGTNLTDSPSGAAVEVKVPFDPTAAIYNSNVKVARVTLPRGMGINPSAAETLQVCTDGQFNKGQRIPVACPPGSKIGTVAINTPPLPDGILTGNVYLGQQLSRDPLSGDEYRIFLAAESAARGLSVRLVGNVSADPQTGQLTAVVREAPQVPFSSVLVKLNGGPQATLSSPPTCGPNATSHAMTAWSGTPDGGPQDKGFTLTSAPGGGPCAKTMAERPFAPSFAAGPKSDQAAAFTPFTTRIVRTDGQQELKGVDITLPPGATAKLAGVPYCPPSALAAAVARSGAAEKGNSSCPDKSQVGVALVSAGTGPSPLQIEGKAFLSGRYRGAPVSLSVITPGVAGPFDLGNVVVRVPLFVDPETAQIHAVSDPIPDVFGGAKLDIRSVFVNVNRKEFTLNGTNCSKFATAGVLRGGGAEPTNPAAFSAFPVSAPFQATDCKPLRFRPKLHLRLFGATKRAKHPRLRATLKARAGDANIARASVGLPHALFLDQASLATICTRVQFAAGNCPKRSVYGRARAFTPLLGQPLEGPVYLRSSNNPLPDLVAHLEGQVDVDLVGRIDSFRGGIRTTFGRVPDVPVSKFTMVLPGGKRGLLVASQDLCKNPVRAIVRFKAQNGKKLNKRQKLRTPCVKKHSGKPKRQGQSG